MDVFDPKGLSSDDKKELLQIARASIQCYFSGKTVDELDVVFSSHIAYEQLAAIFVTLTMQGSLRGCIGHIQAHLSLKEALFSLAQAAAFEDPRFPALQEGELDNVQVELSILSPLLKVANVDDITIPGHGVIVKKGFQQGVFLPQVAEDTGWSKNEFLRQLCASKAGLPPDAWKDSNTELYVFTVEKFSEEVSG